MEQLHQNMRMLEVMEETIRIGINIHNLNTIHQDLTPFKDGSLDDQVCILPIKPRVYHIINTNIIKIIKIISMVMVSGFRINIMLWYQAVTKVIVEILVIFLFEYWEILCSKSNTGWERSRHLKLTQILFLINQWIN